MQQHSPRGRAPAILLGASESKLVGLLSSLPRVAPYGLRLSAGYPGHSHGPVLPAGSPEGGERRGRARVQFFRRIEGYGIWEKREVACQAEGPVH